MVELAGRLKSTSGKEQYGYLKVPVKAVVDEIVDELAEDERVAAAYDLWYRQQEEVLRTYEDDLPPRLPLSRQKEFKRMKNLVIEEAVRLTEYTEVFAPSDEAEQEPSEAEEDAGSAAEEPRKTPQKSLYQKYRDAKRILEEPTVKACAGRRSGGMADSGGRGGAGLRTVCPWQAVPGRRAGAGYVTRAAIWFSTAAEQGNPYAMYGLGRNVC